MNTTKRPAPVLAHRNGQQQKQQLFGGGGYFYNHSTTAAAGRQIKISDMLSYGRENAVPLRHLTAVLQIDDRSVRLKIEQERRSGIPICADNTTGYYLPSTADEKAACVRSMRHRAKEIMKTARAIERGHC